MITSQTEEIQTYSIPNVTSKVLQASAEKRKPVNKTKTLSSTDMVMRRTSISPIKNKNSQPRNNNAEQRSRQNQERFDSAGSGSTKQ